MKPRLMVLVALVVGTVLGVAAWNRASSSPAVSPVTAEASPPTSPGSAPVEPAETPVETGSEAGWRVGYLTTRPGTALVPSPGQPAGVVAGGIILPVTSLADGGYWVLDTCNRDGWVAADDAEPGMVPDGPAEGRMDRAVFVIDPGHGLPDYGAVGPNGLTETEVNLDVSARLAQLLRTSNDIDWATGTVTPGSAVPAAAAAVLTRTPDGPNGGDYQLGLTFRATVANSVDATALVSIHHNTQPEAPLDHPGSEAFVSLKNPESPRLGGLITEELRTGLARFNADWMGMPGDGVVSRVDGEGDDYYTILARSQVPAAIVEGAYISNPSEEALAMTDEFRQAYAEAVYRALVRFVTTDDYPIPPPEPQLWDIDRPPPSMSNCRVPAP